MFSHFLKQSGNDMGCFFHTKIIGFDAKIVIFGIAPFGFGKVLTVNSTFVVYFFNFGGSSIQR